LGVIGRDLKKTIIIDNLYESFMNQPDNGILVNSWYDDMEDTELLTLLPFLKSIVEDGVDDIREELRRIKECASLDGEGNEEEEEEPEDAGEEMPS
jgi:CTD small phosphatase-like protein 2